VAWNVESSLGLLCWMDQHSWNEGERLCSPQCSFMTESLSHGIFRSQQLLTRSMHPASWPLASGHCKDAQVRAAAPAASVASELVGISRDALANHLHVCFNNNHHQSILVSHTFRHRQQHLTHWGGGKQTDNSLYFRCKLHVCFITSSAESFHNKLPCHDGQAPASNSGKSTPFEQASKQASKQATTNWRTVSSYSACSFLMCVPAHDNNHLNH
jgi:hypothetical protein